MKEIVYFFDTRERDGSIYIGFDGSSRIEDHERDGDELLAALPASKDFEDRIHKHFTGKGYLMAPKRYPTCKSIYRHQSVFDYAAWLIRCGFATPFKDKISNFAPLPWSAIDPDRVDCTVLDDEGQGLLFRLGARARMVILAKLAYHSSLSDQWYTPAEIIESARAVLGEIDLDPASCLKANEIVKATHYFTERTDGLAPDLHWNGRVWMNPPFGKKAPLFMSKLVSEMKSGRTTEACVLLNQNAMTSLWFDEVYRNTSAMMISSGRMRFIPGDPEQKFSSPTSGSVVAYFGNRPEVFGEIFRRHGTVVTVVELFDSEAK